MAEGVLMPKAGITVEECIITRWNKKVGENVKIGDILFSYETDKASFECESTADGELLEIFFDDGAEVPVLVNVCAVGKKGEDTSALRPGAKEQSGESQQTDIAATPTEETAGGTTRAEASEDGRLRISPRAKTLAEKNGVNPSLASPSGPYGRIVEKDVRELISMGAKADESIITAAPAPVKPAEQKAAAPVISGEYEDVKLTKIRQVIAKSMTASLSSIPQLTHHHSFDMTNIIEFRKSVKERSEQLGLPKITINDIILYAVSRTLPLFPDFNANFIDNNTVRHFRDVNLGVAADTPRGLMVPTIFGASSLSLTDISKEAKKLIKSAQEGSINPDLLQGGTFTVTNLGSLGVEMFTPVINAPQTAILGVCSVTTRFKMVNGAAAPYQAMGLSLTYDHRVIDGAPAAKFMQALIANLENFTAMLV